MITRHSLESYTRAVRVIQERSPSQPRIACVLGSGLNALAERVEHGLAIPYADIPGFPTPTVKGHAGQLILGELQGKQVALLQGRVHYYEGFEFSEVTFPIRVLCLLGVRVVILTNAAGAVHLGWNVGDIMLITDHINLPGLAGNNPLRGYNEDRLGPRFPSMTSAYDLSLQDKAQETAAALHITLREGVYAMVGGPNFETPAEIRLLRALGADVVGMSTVPEVLVARHSGMNVLALSYISNISVDTVRPEINPSHSEVLETGSRVVPQLAALIEGIIQRL
ncbi:MAG: purine-nucleoside phosphorylase [Anaerolineae bacterium]